MSEHRLTADDARKLAAQAEARRSNIRPYLDVAYAAIRRAAEGGKTRISDPFAGVRMPRPSDEQQDRIATTLAADGYAVGWLEVIPPRMVIAWGA